MDTRPFAPFEWMLALRYLRARRKEGFISVIAVFSFLGILLGVATLIIVMAVMDGFHKELAAKILGLDGHVIVDRADRVDVPDYEDLARRLEQVPTVKHAVPLTESPVLAATLSQTLPAKVRGVTEAGLRALPLIAKNVKFGTIDGFDGQDGIAVGIGFARVMRVNIGDAVTLTSPRGARTPFGTVPRSKTYKVAAIFEMGMSEFDRSMAFMPLAESQRFFDKGTSVDVVDVVVEDPENVEASVEAMANAGIPSLRFDTWKRRNGGLFSVLQVERNTMFVVLLIIMIVAAFNIISGLVMLVKDKGREIGILRTMGATQGAIMRVFLITGASIGVVGTLAGCLFGVLFCWRIDEIRRFVAWVTDTNVFDSSFYFLTKMPADVNWGTTAIVVGIALTLSVLATLYPSWRASRLDPVEALRYE
jgi:lipoprotein-releasing system permease protein